LRKFLRRDIVCDVAEELSVLELPVGGEVAAGYPAEAYNYREDPIDMNKYILGLKDEDKKLDSKGNVVYYNRNKEHIKCVWVTNKNMTGEGIDYTDLIVFDTSRTPDKNSVFLFWLDDEFALKRCRKKKDCLELVSLRDDIPTIEYTGESLQRLGVVTHVIKKYSAYNNNIAGYPDDAHQYIAEGMDFNKYVIGDNYWETVFYLWAGGNSMAGDGIYRRDLLVVDRLRDHFDDSILVFYINLKYTLKRIKYCDDHNELVSSNEEIPPIPIRKGEEVNRWGVLVNVVKKFVTDKNDVCPLRPE